MRQLNARVYTSPLLRDATYAFGVFFTGHVYKQDWDQLAGITQDWWRKHSSYKMATVEPVVSDIYYTKEG